MLEVVAVVEIEMLVTLLVLMVAVARWLFLPLKQ